MTGLVSMDTAELEALLKEWGRTALPREAGFFMAQPRRKARKHDQSAENVKEQAERACV